MIKVPKKLIEETRRLIRIRLFLNECGLPKYYFSPRKLQRIPGYILPEEKIT